RRRGSIGGRIGESAKTRGGPRRRDRDGAGGLGAVRDRAGVVGGDRFHLLSSAECDPRSALSVGRAGVATRRRFYPRVLRACATWPRHRRTARSRYAGAARHVEG